MLSLLACSFALAAEPAKSCCAAASAAPAPAGKPCCAALPAMSAEASAKADAAFSTNSIYQLDAAWTNDASGPFQLGELRGRPVVLTMFFASCPYACPLTLADLARLRDALPADVRAKAQFVLVSFDVVRDTPAALQAFRASRSLDVQWTLLHGNDDAVKELAALLGVKFKQEADGSFSHSNIITILNSEGEIVHQRPGLQGSVDEAAKALVTAAR